MQANPAQQGEPPGRASSGFRRIGAHGPRETTVRFPLADWIDAHPECRYDLATSGMRGSIPPPRWPARRPGSDPVEVLREELAEHLGVDPGRVALAHGASEANALVMGYLAREIGRHGRRPVARVRYPEYPPLFEAARSLGFRVRGDRAAADLAVVSRPRNPEGDLWPEDEVARFASGSRHLLVDETFREFAGVPTLSAKDRPRVWTTGSFTKFFGADELRVGFAVTPPDVPPGFLRYVGLLSDEIAPASTWRALELVRRFETVRRSVRRVLDRNRQAFREVFPGEAVPAAPLWFDRLPTGTGRALAERSLARSVLVAPGEFFGAPGGVRLALTRRSCPQGLRAYRRTRDEFVRAHRGRRGSGRSTAPRGARPSAR